MLPLPLLQPVTAIAKSHAPQVRCLCAQGGEGGFLHRFLGFLAVSGTLHQTTSLPLPPLQPPAAIATSTKSHAPKVRYLCGVGGGGGGVLYPVCCRSVPHLACHLQSAQAVAPPNPILNAPSAVPTQTHKTQLIHPRVASGQLELAVFGLPSLNAVNAASDDPQPCCHCHLQPPAAIATTAKPHAPKVR